ncbi:tol-pal system protein YbgF [Saccharospirillum sp.]|uniref:tol-pal system protein YbgF n=1 Tax=Saccharospirillum sp. TaxID=2033801 RepID=UPI00349FE9AD
MAEPVVIQSQADHVSSPSSRGSSSTPAPDPAFVENLMLQVRDLEQQVAEQRGLVEELNYQIQILQQEQKERYVDLDQRLLNMQQQLDIQAVAPAEREVSSSLSEGAVSDEEVLAEYNAARELIRNRDFPGAITALSEFAQSHPNHELTPNAWYWLGEVHLVSRQVSQAQAAFEAVVDDYEDHAKVPDSLYKLGVIAQQQERGSQATQLFNRVISEYPGSQSAKLAQARLDSN